MDGIYGEALLRLAAERADDPVWLGVWRIIALAGSSQFFSILLPALFATIGWRSALDFSTRVLGVAVVAELLKDAFTRARPDPAQFGVEHLLEATDRFGAEAFPSAHCMLAVVVWLGVLRRWRSPAALPIGAGLVLLIAASRIALLQHDLLDVGGGLGLGLVLLVLFEFVRNRWLADLAGLPWVEQAGLWLLLPLAIQLWLGNAETAALCGVMVGAGAGAVSLAGMRGERSVHWIRRSLAIPFSVAGVALLRSLADHQFATNAWASFGLYAAIGLWVALLIPALSGGARISWR